jgi:protein-S-isoprenylcysteine O-methyltransferase Ste14
MAATVFISMATLSFVLQILSVFVVFKKVESTKSLRYSLFQAQFLATWACFFYVYAKIDFSSDLSYWLASAMIAGCLTLFFQCSSLIRKNKLSIVFSKDSPIFHISKGPYSYIRHPFYASYIFTYVSLTIATQHWLVAATTLGMFLNYYQAARLEEKKFSDSNLSAAYAAYKKTAGMFYPKFSLTRNQAHADHDAA